MYRTARFFARRKILPITPPALIDKFFSANFSPMLMIAYIEDEATFTILVKILSLENYCNTKVVGLGKNFIPQNFSAYNIILYHTHVQDLTTQLFVYLLGIQLVECTFPQESPP